MRDTLIHRGPDDGGVYISPEKKVGLGSRRLKIIDLSPTGHMPMTSTKGGAWITFNGEIYNFKELRSELEKKGYTFKSSSDTEVVLNLYLEYGPDAIRRLNGMFALVIWDESKNTFFAARDHMGIKPFFYSIQNGTFYFASEIKAILANPDFKKELDEENIGYYLTFSATPSPHTLFKNVKKLPAAHYLIIQNGNVSEKEFWNPAKTPHEPKTESYYIEEVRHLLSESIQSQMVSDVPFGCFLSGGIDSSTNATLMSRALGKPVETFSVGSKEFEKYNEFEYSRLVAKQLGANTHEILIGEEHLDEFLDKYPFFADDPNGDQVCLPLYWLSKLARDNGIIMIQIGEGSDELFAGYDTYRKAVNLYNGWWNKLSALPSPIRKGAYNLSSIINNPKYDFHKEYLRRLAFNKRPYWGNAIAFSDFQKESLLSSGYRKRIGSENSHNIVDRYFSEIEKFDPEADFLEQMTYLELKQRLPELLLARADKMTMAHSIEGRVPFLDTRLVELAVHIPEKLKFKNNTEKYILKKAVEGIIPNEIIYRKKQGFGTSMSEWLKPESKVGEKLINIIYSSKLRERDILDYGWIKELVNSHQNKGVEHNFRIWNLVTLSLWYDYWFK